MEKTEAISLVRGLMHPSPSLEFELLRKKQDGSTEAFPFRCQLIRESQKTDALVAAQKYAKKREEQGFSDVYREAQAVEILQRVIVRPEESTRPDGTSFYAAYFITGDQMREALDEAEMAQMLNAYELTKAHFNFTDLSEEAVEKMVNVLANEASAAFFLTRLPSDEWPHLIYKLAQLAQSWRPETPPIPSDSPDGSEPDQETLESGTTGFSTLPEGSSKSSGIKLPTNRVLDRESARAIVQEQQKPKE